MTMTVYHLNQEARKEQWLRCDPSTVVDFDKNFEKVAVIHDYYDDVDVAFRLTNSIDNNWWETKGIEKGSAPGYRSTSVGDIVELSNGSLHMVDGSGWEVVNTKDTVRMKVRGILKEAAFQVEFINSEYFAG